MLYDNSIENGIVATDIYSIEKNHNLNDNMLTYSKKKKKYFFAPKIFITMELLIDFYQQENSIPPMPQIHKEIAPPLVIYYPW